LYLSTFRDANISCLLLKKVPRVLQQKTVRANDAAHRIMIDNRFAYSEIATAHKKQNQNHREGQAQHEADQRVFNFAKPATF
jgi:hypothetical protein